MIARTHLRFAALLGATLLVVSSSLASCTVGEGRFPACKSDAECAERSTAKEAPYCFDVRCVACRSDSDCPAQHACSPANECKRISDAPAGASDAGPEKESWDPSTPEDYDRCMAACKGKPRTCTSRCGKKPKKK